MSGATSDRDLDSLIEQYRLAVPVYVTQSNMPSLDDYGQLLQRIWDSKRLTNNGPFHREFERRLGEYLGAEYVNLFCNGTLAMLVALQALEINGGQVITTPFTFPATAHVLHWNRIQPVFCDIDPETFNLDPARIERLIGPDTKGIMPVHVYGTPCDVAAIQEIANRHSLYVIYDGAHCIGVRHQGQSLLTQGDISMVSFHATKLLTTMEGGALVMGSEAQKKRIDFLKNFGIANQETVIGPGLNGKMNELQAAFGLLQLDLVDSEIANRSVLANIYRHELRDVPGLSLSADRPDVDHNYAYLPILIDADEFGLSRDTIHAMLKRFNVHARKYFYPLCSSYPCYAALPSARPENLPVAERVASQVLCLPIYGMLSPEVVRTICTILRQLPTATQG